MRRVLIVDDDSDMRATVRAILEKEGYSVDEAADGEAMMAAMEQSSFDLLILDLRLPGEDGLSIARRIREKSNLPIVMLTGKDDIIDKVVGLELGADDYITKPFHSREFLARVATVLRRAQAAQESVGQLLTGGEPGGTLRFDGWSLEVGGNRLIDPEGNPVELTAHELQVLMILIQRANRPVSRDQILEQTASRRWEPYDRSVDVVIGKLRKKLRDSEETRIIRTLRNLGYMFAAKLTFERD